MLAQNLLLAFFLLLGHLAFWVTLFNRMHAVGFACITVKRLERLIAAITLFGGIAVLGWLIWIRFEIYQTLFTQREYLFLFPYIFICWGAALCVGPLWVWRRWEGRRPAEYITNETVTHDIAAAIKERPLGHRVAKILDRIPGNQIFRLDVETKTFELEGLPPELDGLTICHLTDLHLTGHLTEPFFSFIIDQVGELHCDMIAITGDIAEKAPCIDWLPRTLGRLSAAEGVFYVLGNHDERLPNIEALHQPLKAAGHIHLGGRWQTVNIRGVDIVMAGNELPWFKPLPNMCEAPSREGGPFRLALSHSPDQVYWAQKNDFDFMLAGHTHGGQIRFPLYGPVISPSHYGVMFASGVFKVGNTLMHVSRGVSGLQTIRLNCPPELVKIVLKAKS